MNLHSTMALLHILTVKRTSRRHKCHQSIHLHPSYAVWLAIKIGNGHHTRWGGTVIKLVATIGLGSVRAEKNIKKRW
ncbi:MAG TPA: hypothetical protein EYP10_01495 [Armatimonadetes bacterium]|nr:hypothetical protein [Armatimonadota bacterium]